MWTTQDITLTMAEWREVIKVFKIKHGADVAAKASNGEQAIHQSLETVKLLQLHGANLEAAKNYGWTPLRGMEDKQ